EDWLKNIIYHDAGAAHTEFRCNIFGQVTTKKCGTIIAAKDNYYAGKMGDKFIPLSDNHHVKDVLVLETPTFAGGHLERLFLNQIGGLNDILIKDEAEDRKNNIQLLTDLDKEAASLTMEMTATDVPSNAELTVIKDRFYDPRLNSDFCRDYFNLVKNKLVQLDIVDDAKRLVAS
ncbi:hypothetical protein H0H92_006873, partial [Tricholoma furcatifolium]